MKKLTIFLLVIAFITTMSFIGVGCKGEAAPEVITETVVETVTETVVETIEEKGIKRLVLWVNANPSMFAVNQLFIEQFNSQNPDIQLIAENLGTDANLADKLNLVYAQGGTVPDIIEYHPAFNRNIIDDGHLSSVPDWVFTSEEMEDQIFEAVLQSIGKDGVYYQVPEEHNFDCGILTVNMDLLEKAGVELPEGWPASWDDVVEVAKKATIFDNAGNMTQSGLALGERDGRIWLAGILQQGGSFIDEDAKLFDYSTEEAKNSLELYSNLVLEDKVWEPGFPGRLPAFQQGFAAMMLSGIWELKLIELNYPEVFENIKTFVLPPFFGTETRKTATYGSWGYGVSASSEYQEAAWKFIQYATSPEQREIRINMETIVPAFKEDINLEKYQSELLQPALEVLPYAQSLWPAKASVPVWRVIDPGVNMVMSGEISVEDALAQMEDGCNELMDEWWRE